MAASRASSRLATWSFWTRSEVRAKRTRQPFSTSARPMAEARWDFPPPGPADQDEVGALASIQLSPAQSAITWALESIGVAAKSKPSRVLPGEQAGVGEMALDAAPVALGDLVFGERGEEAGGGPAFLVGALGEGGPTPA